MSRWTTSAKWAAGPALDGQRDLPLALRLSEGLGVSAGEHACSISNGVNIDTRRKLSSLHQAQSAKFSL